MPSGINTTQLQCIKTESIFLTASLTGTGAGTALTVSDPVVANSEVVTCTFVSTGIHDLVFRRSFPLLLTKFPLTVTGTTVGLGGNWVSFDPILKTARIRLSVGGVVTDAATTDIVNINWVVRNSGKNS